MKKDMSAIISEGMELNDCVDSAALSDNTTKYRLGDISRIEWQKVEHLYIFGFGEGGEIPEGPEKGCYISEDGKYVVAIGATNKQAASMVNRCGTKLLTLDMRFMDLTALELNARLDNLKSLRLSPMFQLSKIDGLFHLKKLETLDLSFTNIGTRFDVSGLKQLKRLELVGNAKLRNVEWLSSLSELEVLDLSGTAVGPEMDLAAFKKLKRVKLIDTLQLNKVYGFGGNTDLEQIDLACSGIVRIPDDIKGLKKLLQLDLSNLALEDLPDWLPELQMPFTYCDDGINLRRTTVPGIDMEIFAQKNTGQRFTEYQKGVLQWFEDLKNKEEKHLNEIKVVFLGDGEAGKSHTIARLMNNGGEAVDYDGTASSGIVIRDKTYDIEGRQVQVHFWDFGGQEILHAMHNIFLTDRTLYVILLNARDQKLQERASYWLHAIQSFAKKDARILLVLNKVDQNPGASVNEPALRMSYPGLQEVLRLSSLHDSPAQFNSVLVEALMRQIKKSGVMEITVPPAWMRLKDQLKSLPDHHIDYGRLEAMCEKCGVKAEEGTSLVNWFTDLGILCCRGGSAKPEDYVVLNPDWITNAISMLMLNGMEKSSGGILSHSDIYHILLQNKAKREPSKNQYTQMDADFILNILREHQLSFPVDSKREFFPMLCSAGSKLDIAGYQEDENVLEFRMQFEYLPASVLYRLIAERHRELDVEKVWRTGARFRQEKNGLSAAVVLNGDTLQIFVCHTLSGHLPGTYLETLKENVDRIAEMMHLSKPANQLIYKCNGKREAFDYDALKEMLTADQTEVFSMASKRVISIADILNQAAEKGLSDEQLMIQGIACSCRQLQASNLYINGTADDRNTYIQNCLTDKGYIAEPRFASGLAASVKDAEQAYFVVRYFAGSAGTMCEGLNIKGNMEREWSTHLTGLMNNSNSYKHPFLVLLTYVDMCTTDFASCVRNYENRIKHYGPGSFAVKSWQRIDSGVFAGNLNMMGFECQYENVQKKSTVFNTKDQYTTVYHIFVRMGE